MRLHLGAVPKSPDFVPDSRWKRLREPPFWLTQLIALPLGIVLVLLLAFCWGELTPLRNTDITFSPTALFFSLVNMPFPSFLLFLLGMIGLLAIHELLHAVVHPMGGLSPETILGLWPSRFVCYAHYDGERSRNRMIVCLLMPLTVISIVPLFVAAFGQISSGWAAFASCFNALASCVDLLGAGMLLIQVPRAGIVRNQGWWTYWREPEPMAPLERI